MAAMAVAGHRHDRRKERYLLDQWPIVQANLVACRQRCFGVN
ncbi:hypothetical protein [Lysobacter gummosus]